MEIFLLFLENKPSKLNCIDVCADNEISLSITRKFSEQKTKSYFTAKNQLTTATNWKFHLIVIQTQLFAI